MHKPCPKKRADNTVVIPAESGFEAILIKKSSVVSFMADLIPVLEESLEEPTETGKPLRNDVVLSKKRVDTVYEISYKFTV